MDYIIELVVPEKKWKRSDIKYYIKWLMTKYVPRNFDKPLFEMDYYQRVEVKMELFNKMKQDLELDKLTYTLIITGFNSYISVLYGKKYVDLPHENMWKSLISDIRNQLDENS